MVVDGVCLDSGSDLVQILKQGAYFLGKKEAQKRLDAFLQDHAHQPLDVVARSAQHRIDLRRPRGLGDPILGKESCHVLHRMLAELDDLVGVELKLLGKLCHRLVIL